MNKNDKILITGGSGLVGHALLKVLRNNGFTNLCPLSSKDCNLIEKNQVEKVFGRIKPDYVFHLAAKVFGIGGNAKYQADVFYENVMMNVNVIESSRKMGVKKIVAMGSGCVYPDLGDEELFEDQIWLGAPHDSVAAYAHSKRLILAQLDAIKAQDGTDYVFAVSGNIFGPHDSFNLDHGNVAPSLIHKFILANRDKTAVNIWGSGAAVRDFSHSEDIAKALYLGMEYLSGPVNIGSGHRHKIADIVNILSEIYEDKIEINYDSTKPDGQLLRYYNIDKLLDVKFSPDFDLKRGITETHQWLLDNFDTARL
jgi:GDP-L-fucose synthase